MEPIIQSEVSQKEKDKHHILTHIYGIQKDGTDDTIYRAAKKIHKEQTFGLSLRRRGWDDLRQQHGNIYITICKIDNQCEFNT